MLHFAQLAAGRISLLTLDMHTLHSTTTTSHHLRQASMLGGAVSATYQQHISNISATYQQQCISVIAVVWAVV